MLGDMDNKNQNTKTTKFHNWFKWQNKKAESSSFNEISDAEDGDDNVDEDSVDSFEISSCISTNELRIFVGTWNVAGRSPVGSLAVDLDEWLNLKDAADMYVLGFQEIVPLKTRNVLGAEDPTEATNWNVLIGKTLNHKYGCPWLTPTVTPISSDNYHYSEITESEKRVSLSGSFRFQFLERSTSAPLHAMVNGEYSKYKLMAGKKMVGVFISVWMKKELLSKYCISNVKVCSVACGIMGYLGNKGSVSVSMSIDGTSFCFIAAHLASGEKQGDQVRRNHQVSEIFRRTSFPRSPSDDDHPLTILGHDRIFWFGDLNYRLYLEDNLARHLIKKQDWKALQEYDQLRQELDEGGVFQGWKEGNIEFAPTYKYSSSNCNRYSGGPPSRSGEKQRTPAWCDRILWYGKGVKQLSYFRTESNFSDHRPVSALFSIPIEVVKAANSRISRMQTLLSNLSKNSVLEEGSANSEEIKSTSKSLLERDLEALPENVENLWLNRR